MINGDIYDIHDSVLSRSCNIPNSDDVRAAFIKNAQGIKLWVTNIEIPINLNIQAPLLPDLHPIPSHPNLSSVLVSINQRTSAHHAQYSHNGHNKTISDKNHINYDGVFAGVAFILAGLIMLGSTVYVFKLIVDKIFASFVLHGRQLHQDLAAAYGSRYYKETDWNPNKTNERTRMLLDEDVLAAMDAANKAAVHASMRAALERSQILVPSEGGPFPRFV
ncbi:hypothetical protein FPQ18DRAFT_305870 [Pyronema domesticum]|nr:hypothetical protein FPQ18DRAFT_305870 [Pyronema domesticum]